MALNVLSQLWSEQEKVLDRYYSYHTCFPGSCDVRLSFSCEVPTSSSNNQAACYNNREAVNNRPAVIASVEIAYT
jgi:hypothetical protein